VQNEGKMTAVTAYIALGSNLGNRADTLGLAIERLGALSGTRVLAVSGFLENPAVGGPADSPAFLNAAVKLDTDLSAQDLLRGLLGIEQSLGRFRKQKWEPRPIDLDLLLYGNDIIHDENLTIPHPLMHQRRFVLGPLAEIAPNAVHPTLGKTIAAILNELPD
jgi:2-amino-4-hydroxy-6-hydroxymethyldihydropteridine diphosphokinase